MSAKNLLIAALLLGTIGLCPPPAWGAEAIAGAFGIRFGDLFPPDDAAATASLNDAIPLYRFTPDPPDAHFTRYYVEISPRTHMVYGIWGYGPEKGFETCRSEQGALAAELEGRHGKAERRFFFAPPQDGTRIRHDGRSVLLRCTGDNASRLLIRYIDRRLQEKAQAEREGAP